MRGAAQYASSADLQEMHIDVDRERDCAQQNDPHEAGAIVAQSRDDEQHRPAPVLP
ncbi:hypothetical protein [Burkholderia sp. Bp8963]|uniref:hypothetical protein n=1 Tax=Burkholderia sp. Bp8963 TaxID=2184547 RepID=UPI00163B1833|nr:hypothetical protein [Burkholderia sp. Bp8963]